MAKKQKTILNPVDLSKIINDPTGLDKADSFLHKTGFEDRYVKLATEKKLNPFNKPENMEKWGAENQSLDEVFYNTRKNFGIQILAGILDGLTTYDVSQYKSLTDKDSNGISPNTLNTWAKELRDYAYNELPVYNSGKTFSKGWWGNAIGTTGYSLGMLAPTVAAGLVISALTGGTGSGVAVGTSAIRIQQIGRLLNGLNMALSGIGEAKLNAVETYENALDKYKGLGYSDEEASKMALKASQEGFKMEAIPLATLNALQFGMFAKASKLGRVTSDLNLGFGSVPESLFEGVYKNIKNPLLKGTAKYVTSGLSEAFEEGLIQTGISNYQTKKQLELKNDVRTPHTIFNDEMLDSGLIGGLTGIAFKGVGNIINYIRSNKEQKQAFKNLEKTYEDFFREIGTKSTEAINKMNSMAAKLAKAEQDYKNNPTIETRNKILSIQNDIQSLQSNIQLEATTQALRLDNIMGGNKAYKAHIEQLNKTLEILQGNDTESLQALGVLNEKGEVIQEGQRENLIKYYQNVLEQSERISKRINNILNNIVNDYGFAADIVMAEEMQLQMEKNLEAANKDLEDFVSNIPQYNKLSDKGKELYNLQAEIYHLTKLEKLTEEQNKIKSELENKISEIKSDTDYKNKRQDQNLLNLLSKTKEGYSQLKNNIQELQNSLDEQVKIVEKISSTEYIKNKIEEHNKAKKDKMQAYKELKKAKRDKILQERKDKKEIKVNKNSVQENKDISKDIDYNTENTETSSEEDNKSVISTNANTVPVPQVPHTPRQATEEPAEYALSLKDLLESGKLKSEPSQEFVESDVVKAFGDINNITALFNQDQKEAQQILASQDEHYSPNEFLGSRMSEFNRAKAKDKAEIMLSELSKKLGKVANFEDFIESLIRQFGEEAVEKEYNAFAYFYELTGRKLEDTAEVLYRKIFKLQSAQDILMSLAQQKPEETVQEVISEQNKKEPENKTEFKHFKNVETRTKAAFLGVKYTLTKTLSGNIIKISETDELNESTQIPNHYVLDPDTVNVGTELEVIIPDNVDDIPVTVYKVDKKGKIQPETILFGKYCKTHNIQKGTQEYYEKVPMIATLKSEDKSQSQERVFFLHDGGWYNETNIGGATEEDVFRNIQQGYYNITKMREAISKKLNNNEKAYIKITDRVIGQIFDTNKMVKPKPQMKLSEATGDSMLFKSPDGVSLVNFNGINKPSKIKIINNVKNKPLSKIGVLEARPVNTLPDGTVEYIILPATNADFTKGETLSKIATNNMKFAFVAANIINIENTYKIGKLSKYNYDKAVSEISNKTGLTLDKAKEIRQAILDNNKIDIVTNIGDYLNLFSVVTSQISTFADNLYSEKLPEGSVFLNFENGILKMFRKDDKTREYVEDKADKDKAAGLHLIKLGNKLPGISYSRNGFTNTTISNIVYLTNKFAETDEKGNNLFSYTKFNANFNKLGTKEAFVEIDDNGNVTINKGIDSNTGKEVVTKTYDDFIKDNTYTNLKSFEIKTPSGETKWITDVQPKILYELVESTSDKKTKSEEKITGKSKKSNAQRVEDKFRSAFNIKTNKLQNTIKTPETSEDVVKKQTINSDTTVQTKQESVELSELEKQILDTKKQLEAIGANEDIIQETIKSIIEANNLNSFQDEASNYSVREFTQRESEEISVVDSKKISKIPLIKQKKVINNLFHTILTNLDLQGQDKINLNKVTQQLKNIVENTVNPLIQKFEKKISDLEKLPVKNEGINKAVKLYKIELSQLQNILEEKNKIVGNGVISKSNPEGIKGNLYSKFERFFSEELEDTDIEIDINEDSIDEDIVDETQDYLQTEKSENDGYAKSSFTKDHRLKFSQAVKVFFSGIPKTNKKTGLPITTFNSLIEYYSIEEVEKAFMEILAFAKASEKDIVEALETKVSEGTKPIYKTLLDRFKSANQDVRNAIMYNMVKQPLEMYSILFSESNKEEGTKMRVINANSNNSIVETKLKWFTNFNNSKAYINYRDTKIVDKQYLKQLLKDIEHIKQNLGKTDVRAKFKEVLNSLGFDLEDNVLNILYNNSDVSIPYVFSPGGLLTIIYNNISKIINSQEIEKLVIDNKNSNPQENAKKAIHSLAKLDNKLNGNTVSKSFRIAGKIVQGTTQRTAVSETLIQLKDTKSNLFIALSKIPYTKNNYILELLENNEEFRNLYDTSYTSLQVLKNELTKKNNNKKISDLSVNNAEIAQLAYFTQTILQLGKPFYNSNENESDLSFRMSYTYMPTISDKDKMVLFHNPTISLELGDFNIDPITKKVILNNTVVNFITSQLFSSEFDRIVTVLNNPTGLVNFDSAGSIFMSIPALNYMTDEKGNNILDLIEANKNDVNAVMKLKAQFYNKANDIISKYIKYEIGSKIDLSNSSGTFFENGILEKQEDDSYKLNYIDSFYLAEKLKSIPAEYSNNIFVKAQLVATEFVLGQILSQHSFYQLYGGDLANYGTKIKKHIQPDGSINYYNYLEDTSTNVLKRMAGTEAPGNVLANSDNDSYLHIAVKDSTGTSKYITGYVRQFYNNSITQEQEKLLSEYETVQDNIDKVLYSLDNTEYNDTDNILKLKEKLQSLQNRRDVITSFISDFFPDVQGYMELTKADAQEYTTWQEHLDVLFRQGRLTPQDKEQFETIQNKLEKGEDLNSEELKLVLQPLKGVYAGINPYMEDTQGNPLYSRFVYIKSSSFPLLPQLTKGLQLDSVRKHMEKLQDIRFNNRTNKPYQVRLSYQSANKIGALDTKLTMEDLYTKSFEELYDNGNGVLGKAISELDRRYFRVQLDVPHKTDKNLKKNKEDSVTLGSQMWKMLMSNGINKIQSKIFPNIFDKTILEELNKELELQNLEPVEISNKLSGIELDKIKTYVEKQYLQHVKKSLQRELGLGSNNEIKDKNYTTKQLYKLLKSETTIRKYNDNIIDALELIEDKNGNVEFKVPLWLSSGSDKFESLIQAIISNRMITWSLPGNSYVVGSSEGFKIKTKSLNDLDSDIKSRIVWVDKNHNGDLKPTTLSDGTLKESEVLLKSHFRINYKDKEGKLQTELIDLLSDKYSYYDEETNKRFLKTVKDKNGNTVPIIQDELLTHFSFRTPTSSHQSGAILRVVGFLPPEAGDLMIVPPEHTAQLGEDYDIDKRNVYNSNYIVNKKNGIIIKLTSESIKDKAHSIVINDSVIRNLKKDLYEYWKDNKKQKDLLSALFKGENIDLENLDSDFKEEIIEAIQSGDKEQLKNVIKSLHSSLKEEDKLFAQSVNKDIEEISNNLFEKISISLQRRYQKSLLENAMIDIYKSVYSSADNSVQSIINKVLSFEKATNTVKVIKSSIQKDKDKQFFSIYSDKYQREQMKLGSDGQLGVAVHSVFVTLHGQLNRLEKPVKFNSKNSTITIGKYTSDGTLGNMKTLDGTRLISDVLTENQNSAVDNIKAMIMGYRNENKYTMNVLGIMCLRGFDLDEFHSVKFKTGEVFIFENKEQVKQFINRPENKDNIKYTTEDIHIPSLFLSQPVIVEYANLKQKYDSEISNSKVSEDEIIERLLKKYTNFSSLEQLKKSGLYDVNKTLTGQTLYNSLHFNYNENNRLIQGAVLKLFLQFKEEGESLSKYQRLINLSSSKLGVSYYDIISRLETLKDLAVDDSLLNIKSLVGDFIFEGQASESVINNPEYKLLKNFYIKPTTTEGNMLIESLHMGNSIMGEYFPYSNSYLSVLSNKIFTEISSGFENIKDFEKRRLRRLITLEFKNYINSTEDSNLFTEDVQNNRKHLFFDFNNNNKTEESLGSFINRLKQEKNPVMYQNSFLKSLEVTASNSYKEPVLIKSVNDENKIFESEDTYEDFLHLLQDDTTVLGTWKNSQITPRRLAQFLATYSQLSDEEGGVYGFKKAVHLAYLDVIGYSEYLRNINWEINHIDITDYNFDNFIVQFFQHNPGEAFTVNKSQLDSYIFTANSKAETFIDKETGRIKKDKFKNFVANLDYFTFENVDDTDIKTQPLIIAFRDSTLNNSKPYRLFLYNKRTGKYERIGLLGSTGYCEYNMDSEDLVMSNVFTEQNKYSKNFNNSINGLFKSENTEKNITDQNYVNNSLREVISTGISKEITLQDLISKISNPKFKSIIDRMLPFLDEGTKVIIDELETSPGVYLKTGLYRGSENTIYISPNIFNYMLEQFPDENTDTSVEEIILEEFIHSFTVNELKKYGSMQNGKFVLNENVPPVVQRLAALYNNVMENSVNTEHQYYMKDIFEFIAGVFVNDTFRSYLDTTVDKNGKSMLETFKSLIAKFINYVTGGKYSDEVVKTVYEFLNKTYSKKIPVNTVTNTVNNKLNKEPVKIKQKTELVEPLNALKKISVNENISQKSSNNNNSFSLTDADLRTKQSINQEDLNKVIKAYEEGRPVIMTPVKYRNKNSIEYQYVAKLLDYIQKNNPNSNIKDIVDIEDLNGATVVTKKDNINTKSFLNTDKKSVISKGNLESVGFDDNYDLNKKFSEKFEKLDVVKISIDWLLDSGLIKKDKSGTNYVMNWSKKNEFKTKGEMRKFLEYKIESINETVYEKYGIKVSAPGNLFNLNYKKPLEEQQNDSYDEKTKTKTSSSLYLTVNQQYASEFNEKYNSVKKIEHSQKLNKTKIKNEINKIKNTPKQGTIDFEEDQNNLPVINNCE